MADDGFASKFQLDCSRVVLNLTERMFSPWPVIEVIIRSTSHHTWHGYFFRVELWQFREFHFQESSVESKMVVENAKRIDMVYEPAQKSKSSLRFHTADTNLDQKYPLILRTNQPHSRILLVSRSFVLSLLLSPIPGGSNAQWLNPLIVSFPTSVLSKESPFKYLFHSNAYRQQHGRSPRDEIEISPQSFRVGLWTVGRWTVPSPLIDARSSTHRN